MTAALCLADSAGLHGADRYQRARSLICAALRTSEGAAVKDRQFIAAAHTKRAADMGLPTEQDIEDLEQHCQRLEDERRDFGLEWASGYSMAQNCMKLIDQAEGSEGLDPDQISDLLSSIYNLLNEVSPPPEGF